MWRAERGCGAWRRESGARARAWRSATESDVRRGAGSSIGGRERPAHEVRLLKHKPMYEEQRNMFYSQTYNLDQVIPSQVQQSVSLLHDGVSPSSRESPARSWIRELLSCSVHELVGETKDTNTTRAKPKEAECDEGCQQGAQGDDESCQDQGHRCLYLKHHNYD